MERESACPPVDREGTVEDGQVSTGRNIAEEGGRMQDVACVTSGREERKSSDERETVLLRDAQWAVRPTPGDGTRRLHEEGYQR